MRYLRTNTAARITVGPFFDKTDGVTPETAITVTGCKLTFMVDDANVPTLVLDTAPTASGGANDMVHVTGDDAGFYDLELAAANVNYLGRAMIAITDAATHCPVFHEFMILPAVVYDAMILGTDLFDVSVTQILGTAVSTPATAGILDVNVKNIDNDAASASGTVTFPNATIASTTNITAGTITTTTNLTTNNDKTGYALSSAGVQALWDALTSALTTVGSIGKKLADWTVGTIDTYTGNTKQTGDNYARLGAPAGASVSADVAAMKVDTAAILIDTAEIGAAGAGLTVLATQASVNTIDDFLDTEVAAIKTVIDKLDTTLVLDGAVYDFTAAALAAAPTGGGLDAAGVRSAIGLASANLDTQLGDLPTNAELNTALGTADDAVLAAIAALTAPDGKAAIATEVLAQAAASPIAANIKKVNDVTIQGTGAVGTDEWRKV